MANKDPHSSGLGFGGIIKDFINSLGERVPTPPLGMGTMTNLVPALHLLTLSLKASADPKALELLDSEMLHLLQTEPVFFKDLCRALELLDRRVDVAVRAKAAIDRVRAEAAAAEPEPAATTEDGASPVVEGLGDESWMGRYQ